MTAASTHPPFDPELSAALAELPDLQHPLLPEDIPVWREGMKEMARASDEGLRAAARSSSRSARSPGQPAPRTSRF